MGYHIKEADLVDAITMSVTHENFFVPAPKLLASLKTGDFIKVCTGGERFWCLIKMRYEDEDNNTVFVGEVNNELVMSGHGLQCGDHILIHWYNVYDIEVGVL